MPQDTDGYRFLVVGVIEQAIKDASYGDDEAMEWLLSEGLSWADCIGVYLEPEKIRLAILARRNLISK